MSGSKGAIFAYSLVLKETAYEHNKTLQNGQGEMLY